MAAFSKKPREAETNYLQCCAGEMNKALRGSDWQFQRNTVAGQRLEIGLNELSGSRFADSRKGWPAWT